MKSYRYECKPMEVESFQHQALEVRLPDETFDPTAEPEDGESFLTKVVYERMNCPSVVVKPIKIDKHKSCNVPDIKAIGEIIDISPECLRPSKEWNETQLGDFSDIREKIVLYRGEMIKSGYSETVLLPSTDDQEVWEHFCRNNAPLLSIILSIDQRSLEKLLEFEVDWLQQSLDEPFIVEHWLGSWIYSTLACLHLPLEPYTHSALREIAKTCINVRNNLNSENVEKAVPLNLLIALISKYFRQLDLFKFV